MIDLARRYWFLAGLVLVTLVTVGDATGTVAGAGVLLKSCHGPQIVVFLIFLVSGLLLDAERIRDGLTDIEGIFIALGIIFIAAPLLAVIPGMLPLDTGIKIGLFLVAVMPTTLTSGVVMTATAGGNMAHALMITVIANALCIFTIPLALPLLLALNGNTVSVTIDRAAIMVQLAVLVLVPLFIGLGVKFGAKAKIKPLEPLLKLLNPCLVLLIVWMAISPSRAVILNSKGMIAEIGLLAAFYHAITLLLIYGIVRIFGVKRGRMESLLFMGGQKTLPLSVILQVQLFPQYGLALTFCVLFHIIHLIMDGYLAGKLEENQAYNAG